MLIDEKVHFKDDLEQVKVQDIKHEQVQILVHSF